LTDALYDKTVLITGGSGSLGHAFTRHILNNCEPRKVVIFSRGELLQAQMREIIKDSRVRYVLGDVTQLEDVRAAFRHIDVVIHAAAYKRIEKCQYNPISAARNNIIGTENVVRAVCEHDSVQKCVFISSDKAVEPINFYGKTKAAGEDIVIYSNFLKQVFTVTRWGNIQASRGSIVPLFKELASIGTVIPITDPRMSRYLVTFDEAIYTLLKAIDAPAGLTLAAKSPSFWIMDLLDALNAKGAIVGRRDSEKYHECLIGQMEYSRAHDMGKYIALEPENHDWESRLIYPKGIPLTGPWTSNNNTDWLSVDDLRERIANA
jgi:UDP-N-acetylglucosamine 4,6-dehydratase/5-epimerase